MTTYTIRPTSVIAKDGAVDGSSNSGASWADASDANITAYTNDSSDTTGIRSNGADWRSIQLDLGDPSIAADEFVCRVAGFLRWSHGLSGKYVGCAPYRPADGVPAAVGNVIVDGRTSPETSSVALSSIAWPVADFDSLALSVSLQGDATDTNRPRVWELGATIQTLKLATATPSVTTMTDSTYPVIPVSLAAVIDWEASTFNWQLLRKVTAEVRVESGGSGVGTGTLVSSGSQDVWFTATGTIVVDVTLPDSLPNGSYKVYARAVRHRENETSVADDQIGVWSAVAALTMTVNPPETPTLTAVPDDVVDRVALTVTPKSTDYQAELLLEAARLWLDARYASASQTITNRGSGTGLDATNGSSGSVDSNDMKWLDFTGTTHIYLPGTASNRLSVPAAAATNLTGDLFLMVDVAVDDYTPASDPMRLIGTRGGTNTGFELMLRASGVLEFQWRDTTGGGTWRAITSSAVTGLTDGDRWQIGVGFDADDGTTRAKAYFWKTQDGGATWTAIGTPQQSGAGVASITAPGNDVEIGARNATNDMLAGKVYGAKIYNGIDVSGKPGGSLVLAIDCSTPASGADTTLAATTGQTVTIGRATAGRKATIVRSRRWLSGTDDFMEVPDSSQLDFGATDSFSVTWAGREWPTPASGGAMVAKRATGQGYALTQSTTTHAAAFTISDGTNTATATSPASSAGAFRTYTAVVNRTAQTLTVYCNGIAGTPVSITSVGSLANAEALRWGRLSGGSSAYLDAENVAISVASVAYTAAQALIISDYFTNRTADPDDYVDPFVSIERSDDGGLTWSAVRDGTGLAGQFADPTVVYDYEAPRGTTVLYRARVSAYTDGILNTSESSDWQAAAVDVDGWNLKVPQAPELNWIDAMITGTPNEASSEDVGVFRAVGRTMPVIVSGDIGGWDGDLTIHCSNPTEWAALKQIIEGQLVAYLEDGFGEAKYIRILPNSVRVKRKGSKTLPRRVVDLTYVETSAPIGNVTTPPLEVSVIIDFGDAETTTWDQTIDGGTATTVTFDGVADGGSAA